MPGSPWIIMNGLSFKGMPIGQEQWALQGYYIIPFADTHAIEIISGYESMKSNSYFAFLLLFDRFVSIIKVILIMYYKSNLVDSKDLAQPIHNVGH